MLEELPLFVISMQRERESSEEIGIKGGGDLYE